MSTSQQSDLGREITTQLLRFIYNEQKQTNEEAFIDIPMQAYLYTYQ